MYTPSHVVRRREIRQVCDENMVVILEACDQIRHVRTALDNLVQTHGPHQDILDAADSLQDATVTLYSETTNLCKQIRGIKND